MTHKSLSQYAFFKVHKSLAFHFKCNDTALLLSHLIDLQEYFLKDKLVNGEFFQEQSRLCEYCNITKFSLTNKIKTLVDAGLLYKEKKTVKPFFKNMNWYRVDTEAVDKLLSEISVNHQCFEKLTTSGPHYDELESDTIDDTTFNITGDTTSDTTSALESTSHNKNINNNNTNKENVFKEKENIHISYKEYISNLPIEEKEVVKNFSKELKNYIWEGLTSDEERINTTKLELIKL